ncbi:hypothetical protein V1525DRAFT_261789 [Lipomyces kononenkoae]|uniref:Uncharacterized protein n=1 Tax=Lipomyces kononenkoae TaxID=34357 RepID=A0ACC3T8S7_LIPKO
MIDSANANGGHTDAAPTSGASFMTAGTSSSAVSVRSDFSFPLRRQSKSPAVPQLPLSAPPESVPPRLQADDSEALSLVPTPSSSSLVAPGNETISTSLDQPQSLISRDNGNTRPPAANNRNFSYSSMLIDDEPDKARLHVVNKDQGKEPKRSASTASTGAGALLSNSKNSYARSHSVSLSQATTDNTYPINGGSTLKRSPFLFSGQLGARQKDSASKDWSATANTTLKKLGEMAKPPKPKSSPSTPEKTSNGLWTGSADSPSTAREISSSPVVGISADAGSEFGERNASDSNYIPLPAFQENVDFSLEEDFKNILNSQDQLAQSSPRSPRSPNRGVGVKPPRFQNLFRKTSRSTLRSFATAGGDSSAATTTHQTMESPDLMNKRMQSSPYISPEDVPTFMIVANDGSSVLDVDDNDDSELLPTRMKVLDADDETTKLKYELVRASQRIVELEAMLKIGEPDTNALEKTIEERRRTIADLEAQTTVVRKEFEVMRGQSAKAERDETPDEVLQRFRDEMEATKNGLQAEIQELISQRNELLDENLRLTKLRDDALQLAEHLNSKNQQLSDLNNELTRQIQERFKTHKGSPSIGSASSGGGLFGSLRSHSSREQFSIDRDGFAKPTYLGRSRNAASPGPPLLAVSSASGSPAIAHPSVAGESGVSGNISTVLEDATTEVGRPIYSLQPSLVNSGNSTTNGGGKKKFWQRGGAAVAKGAVKGFNKMFSADGANTSGQWSGSGNGVDNIAGQEDVATAAGGLNIVMPTSMSASSGLSSLGNNMGKSGSLMRTMKFKGSSGPNEPVVSDAPESGLFGVDIVKRVELEGRPVPFIVTRCIQEVESRGMDYEGIYRKSGIKSQTGMIESMFETYELAQTLSPMANEGLSSSSSTASLSSTSASLDEKERITNGSNADVGMILTPEMIKWQDEFNELMQGDICNVTSALKQYLRRLPVPLVTYDSYTAFITVADDFERKIYSITRILKSLPQAHMDCLEYIVRHLSRVMTHSDKNLMTSLNLAVVFAPTLARDYTGSREMMDAHKRNEVIKLMIENSDRIFATDVSLV